MESIESDSTNSGLVNGLTDDNDGVIPSGGVGVVKRNKKSGQLRSSASSQGSSIRGELTLARGSSETSTASTSSDEEERRKIVKRRKKKTRKHHHSVIHHQPHEEDDDERTDSAEEQQEDNNEQRSGGGGRFVRGAHPRTNRGYHSSTTGTGGMTFDPASSILKPLSPTMLSVGYGADLMMTHPPHVQAAADYSNVTSLMNSPHQSEGHASSLGGIGGVGLSPEQSEGISRGSVSANIIEHDNSVISLIPTTLAPSLSSTVSALVSNTGGTPTAGIAAPTADGTGNTNGNGGGTGVLNPLSSTISAAANALPFAWWSQHTAPTAPIYSPYCGPSGSVATTPVAGTTNATGLLRPGSSVSLRAVICQESDGVLTVNVQWRNKSYSGSLIDVSQHQWAPPRLMEGFQDLPIQLKDFYQKQELEKEPVDVVIDEDKDDEIMEENEPVQLDDQQPIPSSETSDVNKTPATVTSGDTFEEKSSLTSAETITTDDHPMPPSSTISTSFSSSSSSTSTTVVNSSKLDMLMKPPNGFKAAVGTSGITEKLKPPTLPAFDAVKSPQPQIGRDDLSNGSDNGNRKKDTPSEGGTVIIPDTHRNLNTLVDVAAKMKPVLNDTSPTNKGSKAIGNSSKGFITHSESNEKLPVDNISQHQLKDTNKATLKEERPVVKHHSDESLPNVLPFSSEGSPDRQPNDLKEDKNSISKKGGSSFPPPPVGNKQVTTHSWHPPASMQENIKDKRGSPTTSIPAGVLSKPPRAMAAGGEHHGLPPPPQMPLPSFHPPNPPISSSSTVIQKKRKRVSPQNNEMSKRPSPPIKERDSSPLGGGAPQSLFSSPRSFDHTQLLHGSDKVLLKSIEHVGPPLPPPGFVYDPSLPMSYDFQLVSYTREKQAEANRNPDRNTPPTKPQKRQHPPFEMLNSGDPSSSTSRSPPYFASNLPSNSAKRSSSNNATSGSNSSNSNKISPGVVMQTSDAARHSSMIQQSPIKQEIHHPTANRPARPSSKGGNVSMPHVPMGKSSSSHSRKGNPSRRLENQPSAGPIIKQEPIDHATAHPPPPHHHIISGAPTAHLPYGTLHQALVLSSSGMQPTAAVQQPQFTQSHQWTGGVISNSSSSSSSSQSHKRAPSDVLSVPRGSNMTRTPSPAPSKKTNDWQSTHPSAPPPHQQLIKHESISSRQQQHSSMGGGDKHNSISTHGSSSSSSRHHGGSSSNTGGGSKHDSSSSRHVTQSHSIQLPPTIPGGAAAVQTLSPNSYIADLRNGVPMEWMKQHMHLMQLDALKQGGIVGPAPPIQAQLHPQDLAIWQNQMALAAMQQQQLPVDQATMMHLAIQQQQQQQQNDAVTQAFAAQGLFPLQFPTAQVLPFPLSQPPTKRDT